MQTDFLLFVYKVLSGQAREHFNSQLFYNISVYTNTDVCCVVLLNKIWYKAGGCE